MTTALYTLQNETWQVGILPETGASIAFGRVWHEGQFFDVMRPTQEADYANASLCASFIMLPWANRLRDARFSFDGTEYVLSPSSADGTAIHGVVRRLPWRVVRADQTSIRMTFDSALFESINYPFEFSAEAAFSLEGQTFVWDLQLRNESRQNIPVGFGHHPYFMRAPGTAENAVALTIPCDTQYPLSNGLPTGGPMPLLPASDFRQQRALDESAHDDLLTARHPDQALHIVYPAWKRSLQMVADPVFSHVLLFAPVDKPFFALEPQTNANDGFNLAAQGIASAGMIVLAPGQTIEGRVVLKWVAQAD